MTTVSKLIENKSNEIWAVGPDDFIFDAVKLMDEKGIGALAVLLDGALIGIVSERDCARKVILENIATKEVSVKAIMTRQVYYTDPDQDIDECLSVMTQHHIRHLPVMKDEKMISMISMGDVVKEILAEQQFKIDHLEHYISWEESF